MVRKIIWDKEAILQLEEIYEYLKEHSLQSANKVRKSIKEATQKLSKHPGIHSLDRFKKNNDGTIRAFEKYSNRITYKVKETEVIILRVRHTSREPLEH
jgi:plasmid stabilization system protein ParE